MKNLFRNSENLFIILLILLSVLLTMTRDNGVYLFLGVLYSIIIFIIFLFARKKHTNLNTTQLLKLWSIAFFSIIVITGLLILLVILGLYSFMGALQNIG